ncbi:hypothetical protein BGZ61DRAFT_112946 [Ilyonectria robusta]|uniref:uncharacterized protein n=1 Tax=Ilyonectria robusta TaxID=1079257 RepID=UPI001E8CDD05|nr:uncharacterized protein BGZ61DRAFT_112946 [Ilyonectria robusta]KAH8669955.1 hypothetical protein BGZ61DRAFT_112946 [Ilyonectria robusta]
MGEYPGNSTGASWHNNSRRQPFRACFPPDHVSLPLPLCISASLLSMPVAWCEYAFHGGGQIRAMLWASRFGGITTAHYVVGRDNDRARGAPPPLLSHTHPRLLISNLPLPSGSAWDGIAWDRTDGMGRSGMIWGEAGCTRSREATRRLPNDLLSLSMVIGRQFTQHPRVIPGGLIHHPVLCAT